MDSNNWMNNLTFAFQNPMARRGYVPGQFSVNMRKLKALRPNLFKFSSFMFGNSMDAKPYTLKFMREGDVQPAVVMSLDPLLVACYSDELDAVTLQYLPSELVPKLRLQMYSRLLTVNSYGKRPNKDVTLGSNALGNYAGVASIIADLYTDDYPRLNALKASFEEEWWNHTIRLGREYMAEHPGMARNGIGFRDAEAKPINKIKFKTKMKLYP